MVEGGMWGLGESFESWNVKEQASEASEQDVARVQETLQKAKQMRGQIQQQVQHNRRVADLFAMLLQYVDDDALMALLYEQFMQHQVSIEHMFAQFLPRIMKIRSLAGYEDMFDQIWWDVERMEMSVSGVVAYLVRVRALYTDVGALPAGSYTRIVVGVLRWSHILNVAELGEDKQAEFKATIRKELGE